MIFFVNLAHDPSSCKLSRLQTGRKKTTKKNSCKWPKEKIDFFRSLYLVFIKKMNINDGKLMINIGCNTIFLRYFVNTFSISFFPFVTFFVHLFQFRTSIERKKWRKSNEFSHLLYAIFVIVLFFGNILNIEKIEKTGKKIQCLPSNSAFGYSVAAD